MLSDKFSGKKGLLSETALKRSATMASKSVAPDVILLQNSKGYECIIEFKGPDDRKEWTELI